MFAYWRHSLLHLLEWFERLRGTTRYFYPKAFAVFVVLNLGCYWWALLTAYPGLLVSQKYAEYILTGFPVGLLGAVFDCLSLLVTLFIVRRALASNNNLSYIGYLSVDLVIAVLASLWVLFVFMVSGWLVGFVLENPETMAFRTHLYGSRLQGVLNNPFSTSSIKNVYFGVIMGASALIPTLLHLFLAGRSFLRLGVVRLGLLSGGSE